ncbi:hypothetical protein OUZ56_031059 [Daphnia magna]|uniref:Uncharacterized protein n=1 Tax=Daphnia magna TaxID=35525 RepID=A0ABQ9ZT50_9CRUS|nr:hypothetical protein OUZ56_031059 [Daphnia magna]
MMNAWRRQTSDARSGLPLKEMIFNKIISFFKSFNSNLFTPMINFIHPFFKKKNVSLLALDNRVCTNAFANNDSFSKLPLLRAHTRIFLGSKKEIQRKSRKCSLDRLHSSISVSAAARSSNARDTLSKRLRVLRCKPLVRIVRINKPIIGRFILGHSTLRLGQRSPNVKKSVVANFRARFPTTNGVYFEMIDMSFPWLAMC